MKTSIENLAYLFCLSLVIVCGCGSDISIPGKIDISLEEIQQKIVGTWQQDAAELEAEIRSLPDAQQIMSNEQAKAKFEEELKSAARTYVFEASGNYSKKEEAPLFGIEKSGQWRIVPKPESNQLWLQLSQDNFETGYSNSVVHFLEGDRLLIQDGGDGDHGDYTFTRVNE